MNASALSCIRSLRADPHPSPDYRVCRNGSDLYEYFDGTPSNLPLAIDTESLPNGYPYCVTFSHTPGTGGLVYADDTESMQVLRDYIQGVILFHNYLHDIAVMDQLSIPIRNFLDTMVMAYELCLGGGGDDDENGMAGRGSLGLKQLAYRHLNMSMTSFSDTVFPHSIPKLHAYLRRILPLIEYPDLPPVCQCRHYRTDHVLRGKTLRGACAACLCPRYKKSDLKKSDEDILLGRLSRKITTLLNTTSPDPEYDTPDPDTALFDPWKRINQWHDYDRQYLLDIEGPWPVPSVADVPENELVHYACRDADATLRLYHYLDSLTSDGKTGPWLFY